MAPSRSNTLFSLGEETPTTVRVRVGAKVAPVMTIGSSAGLGGNHAFGKCGCAGVVPISSGPMQQSQTPAHYKTVPPPTPSAALRAYRRPQEPRM
jgi:hypothetical protein